MISDGTYQAVLDRFEGDLAALEVSAEDRLYELTVRRADLPVDARHEDAVLDVDVQDGDIVDAVYLEALTEERREDAQSRFNRLSERPPDDLDS